MHQQQQQPQQQPHHQQQHHQTHHHHHQQSHHHHQPTHHHHHQQQQTQQQQPSQQSHHHHHHHHQQSHHHHHHHSQHSSLQQQHPQTHHSHGHHHQQQSSHQHLHHGQLSSSAVQLPAPLVPPLVHQQMMPMAGMMISSLSNTLSITGASSSATVHSSSSTHSSSRAALFDKLKYIEDYDFIFCDESSKYEKVAKIGQGTFGEVFKAREKRSNKRFVAMKKVLMDNEKEGFPITALREIRILQLLKHENVVNLIEICRTKASSHNGYRSTFYLVFDFCEHDLAGLLSNMNVKFSLGEIKKVMQQLLNGLYYIHSNKILHRDMKAANVLITKHGVLKLADFGLARAFSIPKNDGKNRYTNRVVTLWYRPPELLLGDRNYGPPVDMWGAGCIMAEMWTRSPIMQGNTEQQQLNFISQLCGSFTPEVWPGVEELELYRTVELPKNQKRRVKERLRPYVKDHYGCDLLDKLLTLDPKKRIDADTALNHDFFWTDPMPSDLGKMLSQHLQSMFEYLAQPRRSNQMRNYHQQMANMNTKPADNTMIDRVW